MNINWLPNLILLLFAIVFAVEALQISTDEDSIGARMVPLGMSVIMTALVVIQIANDLRARRSIGVDIDLATEAAGAGTISLHGFLTRSAPLIVLMAVYGVFHVWFGYLIASVLTGYLVFRLFGNNLKTILIHGTVGSALLFVIFVKLLNIYDPPGSLIDISGL
ncbi:MAG: tripartite tricarboxylate transporter TctB family protein [Rhodospirillales bacterium]|nr:tripartite tricarboxylate transporter TctB family protein [Rhodospirillales bacterium]